jgi:hypothetical protein
VSTLATCDDSGASSSSPHRLSNSTSLSNTLGLLSSSNYGKDALQDTQAGQDLLGRVALHGAAPLISQDVKVSPYLVVEAEENAVVEDGVEEAGGCGADENRDVLERFYPWLDELLRIRVTSVV